MTDIVSRVYNPNPEKCCERCVFGSGEHAAWCDKALYCPKCIYGIGKHAPECPGFVKVTCDPIS